MSAFLSAFLVVLRRSLANWKLLSSIVVGVLVAVTLVSSTPLFSNALSDLGLRHAFSKQQKEIMDIRMYAPNNTPELNEYLDMTSFMNTQLQTYVGQIISNEERSMQSPTYYVAKPGEVIDVSSLRPTGYFWCWTNLEQHIRLVDGRYPSPPGHVITQQELQQAGQSGQGNPEGIMPINLGSPDFVTEALISVGTAEKYAVKPGDKIIFFSDMWGDGPAQLTIRISGTIEPVDTKEEYWFLQEGIFDVPSDNGGVVIPLFIPEDTFFDVVSVLFPNGKPTYNWYYYVDTNKVTSLNAKQLAANLGAMEQSIASKLPRAGYFSNIVSVINDFLQKQLYTQIPLFLLVFQIVGIILYYVATVANMVIEQEATEIALLRSRGANTLQVFGILFMEGILISAVGGVAGPILGGVIFGLLGKTAPFRPLSGGGLLPVRYSNMVFILAGASAVLCLLAFMLPAIQAARRGIVQQRQQLARPPRAPFWQRYYLDIMLLVAGAALYYELRQRGTLVQQNVFGDLGMDPLLLITPLLFMIAVAIVFLRIFPLIVFVAEKVSKYVAGSSVTISLRYMARNPVHYSRLILLLMMAASVGMFAASFLGTLNRSYYERAVYSVGADVRLESLNDYMAGKGTLTQRYASVPGVKDVSVVLRGSATVGTAFTQIDAKVVAMDPGSMANIVWWRPDFADKPISELMDDLNKDKPIEEGLRLPDGSGSLGVWVMPAYKQTVKIELWARIEDGNNQYWDYDLGPLSSDEWEFHEVTLTIPYSESPLPSPTTLQFLWVSAQGGRNGEMQGLYLDNLQVRPIGSAEATVVETFDEPTIWTPQVDDQYGRQLAGGTQVQDTVRADPKTVHDGKASSKYTWVGRGASSYRGIFPNINALPLQAVVSQSFLDATGTKLGMWLNIRMPGQYLNVEIVDVVKYFPTLDPANDNFMLVNLDRLLSLRNRQLGSRIPMYPNEVWLSMDANPDTRASVVQTLKNPPYRAQKLYDQDQILTDQKSDPLIAAGWGGVLTMAFFGVALVSALGFVVYAYLSARGRQLEFAILRTLGFSFRQVISLIGFEQIFIIVSGMGIGTYVGMRLSNVMLPFLQLTEKGERVLPPFVFVTDWKTIGITYGILAIAFIVTISMVVLFFTRVALSRTLRMGDQ